MIKMLVETFAADGTQLQSYRGTDHGWQSIEDALAYLQHQDGRAAIPNGYEDAEFSKSTGLKHRVTF